MKKNFKSELLIALICITIGAAAQSKPETGQASYYGDDFQGGLTASGERYDKNQLTCSHKIHPFGTTLKITRLDNKKSVTVRVIDRGPYMKGRVVDVSRKAAEALGMIQEGVVDVKVEVVNMPDSKPTAKPDLQPIPIAKKEEKPKEFDVTPSPAVDKPKPANATKTELAEQPKPQKNNKETTKSVPTARLVGKDYAAYDLYQIRLMRPARKGFGVQIASLKNYENLLKQVADLQAKSFDDIFVSVEKGKDNNSVYKVILGNYETRAQADTYQKNLKSKYKISGFIVDLAAIRY